MCDPTSRGREKEAYQIVYGGVSKSKMGRKIERGEKLLSGSLYASILAEVPARRPMAILRGVTVRRRSTDRAIT